MGARAWFIIVWPAAKVEYYGLLPKVSRSLLVDLFASPRAYSALSPILYVFYGTLIIYWRFRPCELYSSSMLYVPSARKLK